MLQSQVNQQYTIKSDTNTVVEGDSNINKPDNSEKTGKAEQNVIPSKNNFFNSTTGKMLIVCISVLILMSLFSSLAVIVF